MDLLLLLLLLDLALPTWPFPTAFAPSEVAPDALPVVHLDMAPTSFDDRYAGCAGAMAEELEELNRSEVATNGLYAQTWSSAATEWRNRRGRVRRPPSLRPEHAVALLAYTHHGPLHGAFNAAVRRAGRSRRDYLDHFPFKVLHFLLSEALSILHQGGSSRCHRVYRGVRGLRFVAAVRQVVRFGHFASASFRNESSAHFGTDTVFVVETCYGVPIREFSFYPEEDEVLIPPFERFEVIDVAGDRGGAVIRLRSLDALSTYNCELVKERRCRGHPCVFSPGWSHLGDLPLLWGLLLVALAATEGP